MKSRIFIDKVSTNYTFRKKTFNVGPDTLEGQPARNVMIYAEVFANGEVTILNSKKGKDFVFINSDPHLTMDVAQLIGLAAETGKQEQRGGDEKDGHNTSA